MLKHASPRPYGARHAAVLIAALSIVALALPSAGRSVVSIEGQTPQALPDYDSRASVAPSADQLAAADATGADVKWNEFGVASSVSRAGAYVAKGLEAPDAVAAARNWLDANKVLFGLDSTDSLVAVTSKPFVGTTNDYAIVFRQQADGVASDAVATVALVGSKDAGWNVTYASSSLTGGSTDATGAVELAPAEAWTQAANDAGVDKSILDVTAQSTTAGATTLTVQGLSQPQHVKKAAFATPHRGARAAYDATVTTDEGGDLQSYQVVVDAQTGDLLYRQSQVDYFADNPTWLAPRNSMPYNNLNAFPWNYPTTDNREIHCWTATAGCTVVVGDNPATTVYPAGVASKVPWDIQLNSAGTDLGTKATVGNNVDDARLWSGSHGVYGNPALVRATSATRDYQPAFTDAWYTAGCNPGNVNAAVNPLGNDIEASTVSLFVGHNVMHDWAYYLGFDEGHWNAQQYNNGVTTNDPSPTPGGPDDRGSARQRRADRKRSGRCCNREPRQREHEHRRRRPAPVDEPVPLATAGRLVLRAVRGRRVRLRRVRPRVRPPDREPVDRQGRRRPPGHPRRRDGRGVRRLRRPRGLQRAAPADPGRLGSVHRGRVRHRQRLQRHPRLPRGAADGR